MQYLYGIVESPLRGDFETYGPRGTNEFSFQSKGYIPDQCLKGHLIESWDISPEQTVWHVRPGIHWAADNVDWMENRELTAEDMVADLLYYRDAPGGVGFKGMSGDIYATDRYTLVIETPRLDLSLMFLLGIEDRAFFTPPEMNVAGADKWENQVGTGPFMFEALDVGSYFALKRNPNYWRTTTIDGVEYELPFVDRIVRPIIPDVATQVAALRTGMIDYFWGVSTTYWDSLGQDVPELQSAKWSEAGSQAVALRCDEPPFDNRDVRRAMMVGTDIKSFNDLLGVGPLPIHSFPIWPGHPESIFTPLEKLPAETRLLYDYNPTLAKQMLADAGYPDGFSIDFSCGTAISALDIASLIKYQWAKIGVEVDIKPLDTAAFSIVKWAPRIYTGSFLTQEEANPVDMLIRSGYPGEVLNYAEWTDMHYAGLIDQLRGELDVAKRNSLVKEAAVYFLNEVPWVPLSASVVAIHWWPWVKNYYGECYIVEQDSVLAVMEGAWLDQDLKEEMGY